MKRTLSLTYANVVGRLDSLGFPTNPAIRYVPNNNRRERSASRFHAVRVSTGNRDIRNGIIHLEQLGSQDAIVAERTSSDEYDVPTSC